MRLRALFSRQPERQLPSDHLHYAGAGDADPPASTPYRTVANEALRQQQDALENNRDHIRPLVLSSAQGTHSIRVDENGIPHAHGTGINGSLAVQNTDTGLPCVTNGHFQYDFYAAEPGWALDVPMVSADQVRTVLFGSHGPIVSDDCIAATFPVTMFPHSVDDPTRQALVSPTHPAISPSEPALQANEPTKAMVPATCTRCKVHGIHTPQECPDRFSESLAIIAEKSRTQHPYKEESATEWIKRAVNDLYDPSVPASAEKARFRQAFLREQADTWPLPPSDSAWATMDPPHPDCDRCNSEQAHLVTFCPSEFGDSTRIHPLVAVWNAFTPRSLFPTQVSPLINLEFPPARPGTPYPHAQEYNELLQDVPSLATASRAPFNAPPIIQQYPEQPQSTSAVLGTLEEVRNYRRTPLPWNSANNETWAAAFAAYLDEVVFDNIWAIRRAIGPGSIRYPDISDESNPAYYMETLADSTRVLRIPGLDNIFDALIRHWYFHLFSGNNPFTLLESFIATLDQPMITLSPDPTQPDQGTADPDPTLSVPESFEFPRELDSITFTSDVRGPFTAPLDMEYHPRDPIPGSFILSIPNELLARRAAPSPWNDLGNLYSTEFQDYIDELVFDNIWKIREDIGLNSMKYPDLSDIHNQEYYLQEMGNGERLLRVPGIDRIAEVLGTQFNYVFLANDNSLSLPRSEAWIRQLFLHWDYLPTSVDRERYMQTHPDSEPVPGLSLATSPASTPPSSQSTNSAKSSPTLVPLSPAGTEDSADSFEDYVYKQALKQYTAEFDPIFTSRSPTPDSLPDLEPPSSGDEGSCLPTPPPDDPVMQNARYTTSWINRTIIGHDDWSSSSPDSSTSQSSSDIPPYDAELQYPEYAHEPIIVAAMFAPKTEDGDHTELSEPNTPARTIGDDIPGLQTQPRRDFDDDGARGSASSLNSSPEAVKAPITDEFIPGANTRSSERSAKAPTPVIFRRKLQQPPAILTLLRRPYRPSPLSAPADITQPSLRSPTPSPVLSLASTASIEEDLSPMKASSPTHTSAPSANPNNSQDIDPPARGRPRLYNPNTVRRRGNSGPPQFRRHARPTPIDERELSDFSYWENKMDKLTQHRAEIQRTIDRLTREISNKNSHSQDPPNFLSPPTTFGTFTPHPIPFSERRRLPFSIIRPDFYNSSTITISARPSTISSVYGSKGIEGFANSLITDISTHAKQAGVPYRLTIMPGEDQDRLKRPWTLPQLPNRIPTQTL
ncbi:hypothetical protein B0H10DRAFT_2233014 [Mycena sp. CBHHK59/15]|nr:hypothetical protein B0H10DRAFT_2233014 [Mycena sp. CBHHK59/15]